MFWSGSFQVVQKLSFYFVFPAKKHLFWSLFLVMSSTGSHNSFFLCLNMSAVRSLWLHSMQLMCLKNNDIQGEQFNFISEFKNPRLHWQSHCQSHHELSAWGTSLSSRKFHALGKIMLLGQVLEMSRESSVEYPCRRRRSELNMSLTVKCIASTFFFMIRDWS